MTSRLGTGKPLIFFYSVSATMPRQFDSCCPEDEPTPGAPLAGNEASTAPGRSRSREPRPLGTGALNAFGTGRRAATPPISRMLHEVLQTRGARATIATTTTHPILQTKFSILYWARILLQFGRTIYTYVNLPAVDNKSERFQGQPNESGFLPVSGHDD
jgi:hypothetical protein